MLNLPKNRHKLLILTLFCKMQLFAVFEDFMLLIKAYIKKYDFSVYCQHNFVDLVHFVTRLFTCQLMQ